MLGYPYGTLLMQRQKCALIRQVAARRPFLLELPPGKHSSGCRSVLSIMGIPQDVDACFQLPQPGHPCADSQAQRDHNPPG